MRAFHSENRNLVSMLYISFLDRASLSACVRLVLAELIYRVQPKQHQLFSKYFLQHFHIFPTTFMLRVSFSPVPECVVISLLKLSFSDPPVPPEPRYCYYCCYCCVEPGWLLLLLFVSCKVIHNIGTKILISEWNGHSSTLRARWVTWDIKRFAHAKFQLRSASNRRVKVETISIFLGFFIGLNHMMYATYYQFIYEKAWKLRVWKN